MYDAEARYILLMLIKILGLGVYQLVSCVQAVMCLGFGKEPLRLFV
jgi:hypothetical protein